MSQIPLGSLVKDKITGFKGIAIGRTAWLHGCSMIGIQSSILHEGKPVEVQWFDEQEVEFAGEKIKSETEGISAPAGKYPIFKGVTKSQSKLGGEEEEEEKRSNKTNRRD
jgi:hypothetical protein